MSTKTTEPGFYWGRLRRYEGSDWAPVEVMDMGDRMVVLLLGDEKSECLDDVVLGERLVHGGTEVGKDAGT